MKAFLFIDLGDYDCADVVNSVFLVPENFSKKDFDDIRSEYSKTEFKLRGKKRIYNESFESFFAKRFQKLNFLQCFDHLLE